MAIAKIQRTVVHEIETTRKYEKGRSSMFLLFLFLTAWLSFFIYFDEILSKALVKQEILYFCMH